MTSYRCNVYLFIYITGLLVAYTSKPYNLNQKPIDILDLRLNIFGYIFN